MRTIGEILKEERLKKKLSLSKIEDETKIKKDFVTYIEEGNWTLLPSFAVVLGFVKKLAEYLEIDPQKASALLKRDYPPQDNQQVNPKPDIGKTFVWSPKLTFLIGMGTVFILVATYLGLQYKKYATHPPLVVYSPKDEEVVKTTKLTILGKTDPDATVKANNQPALIAEDGSFEVELNIYQGTTEIEIKAISRAGKETIVLRKIVPELE